MMIRKVLLAVICCLPFCVSAQNGFTLKGKIDKLDKPATVYLRYNLNGTTVVDSAVLRNGKFKFTGTLDEPVAADFRLARHTDTNTRDEFLQIYLENSRITLKTASGLREAVVKGSTAHDENAKLQSMRRPYRRSADSLVALYNSLSPEERKDSSFQIPAAESMRITSRGFDSVSRAFIAAHPRSYISLHAFNEVELAPNFDPDTAEQRFMKLSESLRESPTGKKLAQRILISKNTNIGRIAPDFTQPDTAGNPVSLSDFRGKYVLLEFWASWCVPCRAENPVLKAAYEKFKDRGFTILGVSLDDPDARRAWLGAINHDGLPWTQTSELKGFRSEAARLYGIQAIPANFLIDPEGKIVARNLRGPQLDKALSALIGEQYTITGRLTDLEGPATAYLALIRDGAYRNVDSTSVVDGQIHFTGTVDVPQPAIVRVAPRSQDGSRQRASQLGFFLENSDIEITGTQALNEADVTGSVSHAQQRELEGIIRPITTKITGIYDIAETLSDEEKKIAADSVQAWVAEIRQKRAEFVENHLDAYFGLYTFNLHVLDSKFDPAFAEPLFHRFSAELKATELGQQALEKIETAKRRQTGVTATDFTQTDLEGKPFQLSSLRGKYVLIDFWASWCVPCRAENPHLVKAYEALKDQNFEIVGVSLDDNKSAWENAVNTDGLPWIHVSDLKGWKNEVATMYDIRSVPQNFLVNPDGVIIAKNLRGANLTETLRKLIQ